MVMFARRSENMKLALERLGEIEMKVNSIKGKALSQKQFEEIQAIDQELKVMSAYSIYNPDLPGEKIAELRTEVWKYTRKRGQTEQAP